MGDCMEPEYSLNDFNRYLNQSLLDFSKNSKECQPSGKIKEVLKKIEGDLEFYSKDLDKKLNASNTQEIVVFKDKLGVLQTTIKNKVQEYHKQHSSGIGAFLLGMHQLLHGSIDVISDSVLDRINNINASVLNKEIKSSSMLQSIDNSKIRILPMESEVLSQVMSYLPARDFEHFSEVVSGSKIEEKAVSGEWLIRARQFGYKGANPKEAEKYINDLGSALSYLISRDDERNLFQPFKNNADADTLLVNREKIAKLTIKYVHIRGNEPYNVLKLLLENGYPVDQRRHFRGYGEPISLFRSVMEQGYTGAFSIGFIDNEYLEKLKLLLSYGADIDFIQKPHVNYPQEKVGTSARQFAEENGLSAHISEWEQYSNEYKQEVVSSLRKIILEEQSLDHFSQTEIAKLSNSIDVRFFLKDESKMAELPKTLAAYVIQNQQKLNLKDDDPLVKASLDILR